MCAEAMAALERGADLLDLRLERRADRRQLQRIALHPTGKCTL
jgi:hypothetical protein